jgi:hypothetical protein
LIAETNQPKFRFDAEKHEYWFGDQLLPHPTGVLDRWNDFSKIPPQKLFIAREFGKRVHEYIAAYNNGTLDVDAVMPKDEEYDMGAIVRGYDELYREMLLVPHVVEEPIMHMKLRYGCTADFISGDTVFDLKPMSRFGKKTVGIQLAANAGAAISNDLINAEKVKMAALHYDSWGKWRIKYYPFIEYWNIWMCMLTAHNFMEGK